MKKITLLLLTVILLLLLAACGPAGETTPTPEVSNPAPPVNETAPGGGAYPAPEGAYPAPGGGAAQVPDGQVPQFDGQIAFHSERDGILQIFLLDGASGELTQLTKDAQKAYEPQWSPDCQQIVYTYEVGGPTDSEIYTMNADGSGKSPLLNTPAPATLEWSPAWSPNGQIVAYQTNPGAQFNICFADVNGSSLGCMDPAGVSNAHPFWSPDGSKLYFVSNRDGNWDVYVMEYGSSAPPTQLTNNDAINFHPRVSPDGQSIVFESKGVGFFNLWIMNADGSNPVQLTSDMDQNSADPFWVGNDKIVFASDRMVNWELFMINRDGSGTARLTYDMGTDKGPVWCAQ